MRIAVASLYPIDPQHIAGGMRNAVYHLVQALACDTDLDVHVVYCHSDVERDTVRRHGNATVHYLGLPRRGLLPNYVRAISRTRRALASIEPDVVNAHTSHYAIASLRAGLPTVLTLHGVAHREAAIYNQNLYDRLRYGLATIYDRYALARVRDVVAISPYVMREYAARTRARWHRIDNPLPETFFSVVRKEQPGRLLFAGSITPLKDILTALRAFLVVRSHLPDTNLRLAGRTADPNYEQQLRQFVASNGLSDHVHFLGLLGSEEMLQEYASCSMLVVPSRQEVLPMAVIEGMAAGVPVVATQAGGLPDLITDGVTGLLVEVGDHVGMAEAMLSLLQDQSLRQRMGTAGREVAHARFRASVVAAAYRRVYEEVAHRPVHSGREGGR